jgi:hypothetical protein
MNSTAKVPVNCSGISVSSPGSLLQQLSTPLYAGAVVDVAQVLQSIAPPKLASASGWVCSRPWYRAVLHHFSLFHAAIKCCCCPLELYMLCASQ